MSLCKETIGRIRGRLTILLFLILNCAVSYIMVTQYCSRGLDQLTGRKVTFEGLPGFITTWTLFSLGYGNILITKAIAEILECGNTVRSSQSLDRF